MTLIGQFLIRTIIIYYLGANYLGLNSLMISILQVLNLTELGFSQAIIYSLYKPLAEENITDVRSLLNFYRKIYRFIGLAILLFGLLLLPILPLFIKQQFSDGFNVYVFYIIYLFNTSISYFLFAYKSTLLTASQRNDILSRQNLYSQLILYFLQILVLIITRNMYLFAGVAIVSTIYNNIMIEYESKKLFPHYFCEGFICNDVKSRVKKLVGGIMIQRLCQTFRSSLNTICLSLFTTLSIVAIYGNYYFFLSVLISLGGVITTAICASIGNCVATKSVCDNYLEMHHFIFGYSWLSGWAATCLLCLYNPIMKIWMGENMLFPLHIVILLTLLYYALSMGDIRALYHSAAGLWWEGKNIWLIEAMLNLILNLILGFLWGVEGLIIASLITVIIINFGLGSTIVFKYYFITIHIKKYFYQHLKYLITTIIISGITYIICNTFGESTIGLLLKILVCLVLPNCLYYIVNYKSEDYKYLKNQIVGLKKR